MRLSSRLPEEPNDIDPSLAFYARCLKLLSEAKVPFLVGGTYALKHHTGIVRDTKDLDLFVRRSDLPRMLEVLQAFGYRTEIPYGHWLAKAYSGATFMDLIFDSGNGLTPVDDGWFTHASRGRLLGVPVAICPAEETLWSKAFVMERERYDGADVAHILEACSADLDWDRLLARFGDHWRVLLGHLVLFGYIYPDKAGNVPRHILETLTARALDGSRPASNVCRGTNLSREQYLVDLESGRPDGRLEGKGGMTADDVAIWTAAIPPRA